MSTYLLVWNPAKWTFQDWPQALADMAQQGFYICQWSCMSKKPVPGDTVLLKKTGKVQRHVMDRLASLVDAAAGRRITYETVTKDADSSG